MTKRNIPQIKKRSHPIIGTAIRVNGRIVGQVIGNEYVKDFKNGHMLTEPPAIASDIQALHDAEKAGAEYCKFTNTDTGIVYRVAISKIWERGRTFNFGFGSQVMCTLNNWTQSVDPTITNRTEEEVATDPTFTPEAKPLEYKSRAPKGVTFEKGKPQQLSLFGGRR